MNNLLVNAWQTPDGTVLESRGRHDFKCHLDSNGEEYIVDGGLDYIRCTPGMKFVGCYAEDPIVEIRELFTWGTYGKDGKSEKHYVKLKDMETSHINAILSTQQHIKGTVIEKAFLRELEYRAIGVLSELKEI